jgi:hypothetical protein
MVWTITRVKVVVLVTAPPAAATVMGKLPPGVAAPVLMVKTREQVGLQWAEEKAAVAPEGTPETEKETG